MARGDHTRVGWWLMTHGRAGSALIGSVALTAVIADTSYVATDWQAHGGGFVLGVGLLERLESAAKSRPAALDLVRAK